MSKETKDHAKEPRQAPAPLSETDPAAAPFDENNIDYNRGRYHGLTEEQIKKVEEARYDDTEGVPPPELPPVEEPADAKAKAKAEKESEAEAEKKRGAKHG